MSYAVRDDGQGFRSVNSEEDCGPGEFFSDQRPPTPAAPPIAVVTMRQARLALLAAGQLDAVAAVIDALPTEQRAAARIEWEFASEVRKDSPLIAMLAPTLGMDQVAVTNLFEAASVL